MNSKNQTLVNLDESSLNLLEDLLMTTRRLQSDLAMIQYPLQTISSMQSIISSLPMNISYLVNSINALHSEASSKILEITTNLRGLNTIHSELSLMNKAVQELIPIEDQLNKILLGMSSELVEVKKITSDEDLIRIIEDLRHIDDKFNL